MSHALTSITGARCSSFKGNRFLRTVTSGRRPAPTSRGPFGPITKFPRSSAFATTGSWEPAAAEVPSQQSLLISVQGLNQEKVDGFLEVPTPPCLAGECALETITLDYSQDFGSCPLEPVFALKTIAAGNTEISPYVPLPQVPEPLLAGRGAGTLVMPFDARGGRSTELILHRVGDQEGGVSVAGALLAAHVVFYDELGATVVDGVVCLAANGSVVLDPADLSVLTVSGSPPGAPLDLTGTRGAVVVTGYEADADLAGMECRILDPTAPLEALLAGSWTIRDPSTFTSFSGDAVALPSGGFLPDPSLLDDGLFVSTFSPFDLEQSQVVLLGLEKRTFPGGFVEVAPIPARAPSGVSACCALRYQDRLGEPVSLPDFCFGPVGFAAVLNPFFEPPGDPPLIPDEFLELIGGSGQFVFDSCTSFDAGGSPAPLGRPFPQFLFAALSGSVGPFSTGVLSGKYSAPAVPGFGGVDQPPQGASGVLVLPFDVTENAAAFQIVSTLGFGSSAPIGTHWAYWSADGTLLAEIFVCLEPFDTVSVDPTGLMNVSLDNHLFGEPINLAGERGFVVVTAYDAPDLGSLGDDCRMTGANPLRPDVLVGNWLIANIDTNSTFGGEALGFAHGVLPDTSETGRSVFTLDPQGLTNSQVMTVGLELNAGPAAFPNEIGPIPRTSEALAGGSVCCQVDFVGTGSDETSLPTLCFTAAAFHPVTAELGRGFDVPLVPSSIALGRDGYVRFKNCVTPNTDGSIVGLGEGTFEQAFFAIHTFNSFGVGPLP